MFSGLDRPPDCETLEYAWLVEIQLGILSGRLTMPQVMYVVKPSCTRQNNYRRTVLILTLSCLRSTCYGVQFYCFYLSITLNSQAFYSRSIVVHV